MEERLVSYCKAHLDFTLQPPPGYQSAPLCALDSVFSIGVNYQSVINLIPRFISFYNDTPFDRSHYTMEDIVQMEITTTQVINRINQYLKEHSFRDLAVLLHNECKTDTHKNAILKIEAYFKFLHTMQEYKIETTSDVQRNIENQEFIKEIRTQRGQRSGLTIDYLFILAKAENYVKVDRHIERFTKEAIGNNNLTKQDIINLIRRAASILNNEKEDITITARILDHMIWKYQSNLNNRNRNS